MQSDIFNQNGATESHDIGDDEDDIHLDNLKIEVFPGTKPLITTNSIVKTFQRESTLFTGNRKKNINYDRR